MGFADPIRQEYLEANEIIVLLAVYQYAYFLKDGGMRLADDPLYLQLVQQLGSGACFQQILLKFLASQQLTSAHALGGQRCGCSDPLSEFWGEHSFVKVENGKLKTEKLKSYR